MPQDVHTFLFTADTKKVLKIISNDIIVYINI